MKYITRYVKLRCVQKHKLSKVIKFSVPLIFLFLLLTTFDPFDSLAELAILQTTKTNGLSGLFVQWTLMNKLITNIQIIF